MLTGLFTRIPHLALKALPIVESSLMRVAKESLATFTKQSRILIRMNTCIVKCSEQIQQNSVKLAIRFKTSETVVKRINAVTKFAGKIVQDINVAGKIAKVISENAITAALYAAEIALASGITYAKLQYQQIVDYFKGPTRAERLKESFKQKVPLVYWVLTSALKVIRFFMHLFMKEISRLCGLLRQVFIKTKHA